MGLLKGVLFVVTVLAVSMIFFSFVGNLSEEVSFSPFHLTSCSEADLISLWNGVFVEQVAAGEGGLEIHLGSNQLGSECQRYVMYLRKNGDDVFYLSNEFLIEGSSTAVMYRQPSPNLPVKLANQSYWKAYYMNSSVIGNDLDAFTNYQEFIDYFNDLDESKIVDRNIVGVTAAVNEYSLRFLLPIVGNFVKSGDIFGVLNPEYYVFTEKVSGWFVYGNKDWSGVGYTEKKYVEVAEFNLTQEISNKSFVQDSDWNLGFKLEDHFNDINASFTLVAVGISNVSFKITDEVVYFKPNASFVGVNTFRVVSNRGPEVVVSNNFNVNITNDTNSAPTFKKNFPYIYMVRGEKRVIDLTEHFTDLDGDSLTYITNTLKNLSVKFSGDDMTIELKTDFSGFERFKVTARDGKLNVSSNWISVFLNKTSSTKRKSGINNTNPFNNFPTGPSTNNFPTETETKTGLGSQDIDWGSFWVWLLVAGGFVLLAGLISAYFLFWKKPPKAFRRSGEGGMNTYPPKMPPRPPVQPGRGPLRQPPQQRVQPSGVPLSPQSQQKVNNYVGGLRR